MSVDALKFVDRVQFFPGQRLLASDLQALEEYQREMRWLHNRSLHQPGVASGYAVRGEQGERALVIQPGYAVDNQGREIILTEAHVEPVPPVAHDGAGNPVLFDLTVSYSASLPPSETRAPVCQTGSGATRLRESPVFCWVRVGAPESEPLRRQIESSQRILLARVEVLNCQLRRRASIAQRKNARPSTHPYVFTATTEVKWEITAPGPDSHFGIKLTPKESIDTSLAGFKAVPCYFAQLLGAQSVRLDKSGVTLPLDAFVELYEPEADSFKLSVLIPTMLFQGTPFSVDQVCDALKDMNDQNTLTWQVSWMGVEG